MTGALAAAACATTPAGLPTLRPEAPGGPRTPEQLETYAAQWTDVLLDARQCGVSGDDFGALVRAYADAQAALIMAQRRGELTGASQALAESLGGVVFDGAVRLPPGARRCTAVRRWASDLRGAG